MDSNSDNLKTVPDDYLSDKTNTTTPVRQYSCPTCGYCPTCGRPYGGQWIPPSWNPQYPWWGVQPRQPFVYC